MLDHSDERSMITLFVGIGAVFVLALCLIIFEPRTAHWVADGVEAEFANSNQVPQPSAPKLAETPYAK